MSEGVEDIKKEIERLTSENEKLRNQKTDTIHFKISQKGAVSVYGLGRYPLTLYKNQWYKLLNKKDELLEFILENEEYLK